MISRIEKFAHYRKQIKINASELKQLQNDWKKLQAQYKEAKKLMIPNLPELDEEIKLVNNYVYELGHVKKNHEKIREFTQHFNHEKIQNFIERIKAILLKEHKLIFEQELWEYQNQELISSEAYQEIVDKSKQGEKLKDEFNIYKQNLDSNMQRLEETLLKAKEYLNTNPTSLVEKIEKLQYHKQKKITKFVFYICGFCVAILLIVMIVTVFVLGI